MLMPDLNPSVNAVTMDEKVSLLPRLDSDEDNSTSEPHSFDRITPQTRPAWSWMEGTIAGEKLMKVLPPSLSLSSVDLRDQHVQTAFKERFRRFGYAFVPQYIRTRTFNDPLPVPRVGPTSWLDGLRGIASLGVVSYHYINAFSEFPSNPWGEEGTPPILAMPFIRLLFSGMPMVLIFFVAGGYSISLKPLTQMAKATPQSRDEFIKGLTSSVFRRWFRLYLPAIATSLIAFLLIRSGWMELTMPLVKDPTTFHGWRERQVRRLNSWNDQTASLWDDLVGLFNIFQLRPKASYDPHLWSIMAQYRASLVVYLSLVLVVGVKASWRLPILFGLSILVMKSGCHELTVYLWGVCIAQIDIMSRDWLPSQDALAGDRNAEAAANTQPSEAQTDLEKQSSDPIFAQPRRTILRSCVPRARLNRTYLLTSLPFTIAFIFSLVLLSAPRNRYWTSAIYAPFAPLVPRLFGDHKKAIPGYGAVLLILTLCLSRPKRNDPVATVKRLLAHHIPLYLGKLSFAAYLVHGTYLHAIGQLVPVAVWWLLGFRGEGIPAGTLAKNLDAALSAGIGYGVPSQNWIYVSGIAVGWVINMVMIFAMADVFSREIETRSIYLTKWLESYMVAKIAR